MPKNQTITYVKYKPNGINEELTAQLVDCYREVFATQPWGEWLKCPSCEKSWGVEEASSLAKQDYQCCGQDVVDYWPRGQVLSDIQKEITDQTSCWLAMDGGKVIGFCWGYYTSLADLEEKVELPIDLSGLSPKDKKAFTIFYQDEMGVRADYRGFKIAKELFERRKNDVDQERVGAYMTRTKYAPEPSVTYSWYTQKKGYNIVAAYPERDGRVIIGKISDKLVAAQSKVSPC